MMNKKSLELYVHIPFCIRKCLYCDFLSFTGNQAAQELYVRQLTEEIKRRSADYLEYQVTTIFIGGGTPSLLDKEWMQLLIQTIRGCFSVDEKAEITIEINPGTVTKEKLRKYRELGINRISIGLQSADDTELRQIGRIHTYETFLKSYELVRGTGFTNVNIDLMSALPGQTMESWKYTLKKVTMLRPEHISAYSLIVEEGTPFFEWYGNEKKMLPEDRNPLPKESEDRAMYRLTNAFLKAQGYHRYEISNYARRGYECIHNIGYWTGTEYLGVGLGAASYVGGCRFHNTENWETYTNCHMVEDDLKDMMIKDWEELNTQSKMEEFMFLGLRLTKGVSELDFASRFGQNIWEVYGYTIKRYMEEGMIRYDKPYIYLSEQGIDISNYIMSDFIKD